MKKILRIYGVISILLTIYYVISSLLSNFENPKDWIFYFVMPFYLTDNFLPDSRTPFSSVTVVIGFVLFLGLAVYAMLNKAYFEFIMSLGWIIPCGLYGLIYITEKGE